MQDDISGVQLNYNNYDCVLLSILSGALGQNLERIYKTAYKMQMKSKELIDYE